uniref:Uncharacterized protein n=1 Tax=Salix viminalis TaxID=40686 RepID=A0A6N2MJ06_SALVM
MVRGADRAMGWENEHSIKVFLRNPEETGRAQFSTCFHMPVRNLHSRLPCRNETQEVGTESCLVETAHYPQLELYNGGN